MATPTPIGGWILEVGIQMSQVNPKTKTNKVASRSYFINATDGQAYLDATSAAERDSSNVGVFLIALQALTLGTIKTVKVGMQFDTAEAAPASTVFAFDFDQFLISSRDTTTTDPVKTSIPARKDSAITIESDGVTVPLTGTAMAAWVAAYEQIVLSPDDNAVDVIRATISE